MNAPAAGSLAPWFNASGRKIAADDVRAYAAWLDAQGLLRWLYTGRAA